MAIVLRSPTTCEFAPDSVTSEISEIASHASFAGASPDEVAQCRISMVAIAEHVRAGRIDDLPGIAGGGCGVETFRHLELNLAARFGISHGRPAEECAS